MVSASALQSNQTFGNLTMYRFRGRASGQISAYEFGILVLVPNEAWHEKLAIAAARRDLDYDHSACEAVFATALRHCLHSLILSCAKTLNTSESLRRLNS